MTVRIPVFCSSICKHCSVHVTPRLNATKVFTLHTLHLRYIAAEGGNVVPESMKQKSKTIFPNDIVAKSRAGTNTLQRLNATSTFTLHLTPDQDNTSQNAFVIIIIPARRSLVVTRSLDLVCLHNRRPLIGSRSVDICCNTAWV